MTPQKIEKGKNIRISMKLLTFVNLGSLSVMGYNVFLYLNVKGGLGRGEQTPPNIERKKYSYSNETAHICQFRVSECHGLCS